MDTFETAKKTFAHDSRRLSAVPLLLLAAMSPAPAAEMPPSWWEAETAMGPGGSLRLDGMSWWERARGLAAGESFRLTSAHPGGGTMLVRRERLVRRGGREVDAIVWVIDDDGDLGPRDLDGDRDGDCYVVDYGIDGRVDRMVDYLQGGGADGRGADRPGEMEIRYFQAGRLRRSWFGLDLDGDGRIWDLAAYEYSGDFFRSDPRGNNMIFMNEYDPERDAWVPSCECPFAFYDTDGDGESVVTIRVSAVPLDFDPWDPFDMDYGNAVFKYTGPFTERMRRPGAVNIRYSRDLDGLSSAERPLHYEMGFNLIGRVPYEFPGMARTHPLRRPPKTTRVIPHEDLIGVAELYPADRTGFSWREYGDDAIVLGSGAHAEEDRRWEGVFWTWSRRFMHNTGGPIQEWNVRREFRPTPSERRRLYWCRADRRIHLEGATDGWIRVGHLGDAGPWGEIRLFDTDRDGYFDRWETHLAGASSPARISTVRDPGVRELPGDWDAIGRLYAGELLPAALASTRRLAEAMRGLADFAVPEHLARALRAASCDSERLYIEGLILESRYLALRRKLDEESRSLFERFGGENLRSKRGDLDGSIRAWERARLASDLDAAYGEGRFEDALRAIGELKALAAGEAKE